MPSRSLFDSTPETRPSEGGADTRSQQAVQLAGWILRPDVDGRIGWEAPNLPERLRWWARFRFDELPTIGDGPGAEIAPGSCRLSADVL
jgi:hypothetical protein